MKIRNIFGNRYKGTLGKDLIASSWKGHHYIKEYKVPRNPNSERQRKVRGIFRRALEAWRGLKRCQTEFYNRMANGMSGYNLFVGRYIRTTVNGGVPEVPALMSWSTSDGEPVQDGWLIVRCGGRDLFVKNLRDGGCDIALTSSDTPYTFLLRKDAVEEVVLEVEELREDLLPSRMASASLGIELVRKEAPTEEAA